MIRGPLGAKALVSLPVPVIQRFLRRLQRQSNGCLEYMGSRPHGYGAVRVGTEMYKAHRIAWFLAYGPLAQGELVLHRCDNPPCCDYLHLFKGTSADNFDDMIAKERDGITGDRNYQRQRPEEIRRGTAVACSVLNEATVVEIRTAYANGGVTQEDLARKYGIWQNHISKIVRGDLWSHVGGPLAVRR